MIVLALMGLYLAAIAGIVAGSFGAIHFAGGALSRARPQAQRTLHALCACLCLCGIVASGALGFVGMPAIMYLAGR